MKPTSIYAVSNCTKKRAKQKTSDVFCLGGEYHKSKPPLEYCEVIAHKGYIVLTDRDIFKLLK